MLEKLRIVDGSLASHSDWRDNAVSYLRDIPENELRRAEIELNMIPKRQHMWSILWQLRLMRQLC
jgi:hypothetical protein